MKFCPKCGAKLAVSDKFCDRCGTDVSTITGPKPKLNQANNVKTNQIGHPQSINAAQKAKLSRNQRIRKNCMTILACVLMIAAAGIVFFTLQSRNSKNTAQADFNKTAQELGFDKASKIKPKDTAGLAISYAHMHFKDDPNWDKIFDEAENGDLNIKALPEYDFDDYKVQAPKDGRVVVLNDETGYVVTNISHPAKSHITYVTKKGPSKEIFFPTLAKKVVKSSPNTKKQVKQVHHLIKQINMQDKVDPSQNTSGLDDDSSANSNSDSDSDSSNSDSNSSDTLSWNDDKEEKLADFMDSFGKKMDQDYDEYNGDDSLHTAAGQDYPDIFDDETFKLYSDDDPDGSEIDLAWDPKLEKDDDDLYHVVAIFNANVKGPEQHITYIFCIYNKKPVVLVDQTTNGDAVKVKETSNSDVNDAFKEIIAEK